MPTAGRHGHKYDCSFFTAEKRTKKGAGGSGPPGPLNGQGQAPGPQKPWADGRDCGLQEEHPYRFAPSAGRHGHKYDCSFFTAEKRTQKGAGGSGPPGPLNGQGQATGSLNSQVQAPGPQKPWADEGDNGPHEEHRDRFVTFGERHGHSMPNAKKTIKKLILPVLPLRGLTVFPQMELHFDVGRDKSVKALEEAMMTDQLAFLVTQIDARVDEPGENDIFKTGTVSKVKQLVRIADDTVRVRVEGICRAQVSGFVSLEPFFMAEVVEKSYTLGSSENDKTEALKRQIYSIFDEYIKLNNRIGVDSLTHVMAIEDPGQLADVITANIFLKTELKQEILDQFNPISRLETLLKILTREVKIFGIEKDINAKVRKQIDKTQKEYYLREQVKAIQVELGEKDGIVAEVEEYRERLKELALPEEVEAKVNKEIDRLSKMQSGFAESAVVRTYLDWLLELPWTEKTEESLDLANAEKVLNEDHYGLEKLKERILEYLAVRVYKDSAKGPILCLVGPPGVGKTSVAKSIARALNRKYVRMSLGGVRDEAEIRGHRRTYIGALPGRIISAMKQAGSKNPLILLDEIDKMCADFRGDPAAAMLEVLDSEQNFAFRDHYIELPYDLSDVLFVTTANNADSIPKPLLDRMEKIDISGYTEEEKVRIALDFLAPKQQQMHGISKKAVRFDELAIRNIINYYTRESGVRNLEREIAKICRKTVREMVSTGKKTFRVTGKTVEKLLGAKKFRYEKIGEVDEVGVAKGLAWTPVGGDTLSVEVNLMNGTGQLELTGQLGDVMKESAKAAVSFIRSRADYLNVDRAFYSKYDVHIHVPEGAIPKDGPSAGITLATAMASALTGRPVRKNVAMTGEITLRGRVLPIGGLKEKVLAAHRAGIDTVIVPLENKRDIDDIPENVRGRIRFILVSNMDEVLDAAFAPLKEKAYAERSENSDEFKMNADGFNVNNEVAIDGSIINNGVVNGGSIINNDIAGNGPAISDGL